MIDILIIGFGSIGRKHAKILKKNSKVENIYVLTSQAIKDFKKITVSDLRSINPKYIVVANQTSLHLETIKLIEKNYKNKIVLVEKPIFNKFYSYKPKNNLFFIGYNLRLHPVIKKIKDLIKNKKIWHVDVRLETFLPHWRKNIHYSKSNTAQKSMGGGVLLELSHELDYLQFLFGKINPKFSYNGKKSDLNIDTDDLLVVFGMMGNIKEKISLSLMLNCFSKNNIRQISIVGKNISINADLINHQIKYTSKEKTEKIIFSKKSLDNTYTELHDLIISMKKNSLCTFKESVETIKLTEKLQKINSYE